MMYLLLLAIMILFPIIYLKFIKKMSYKAIEKELFPKSQGLKKEIIGALALGSALIIGFFALIIVISAIESTASVIGVQNLVINDLKKVSEIVMDELLTNPENFLLTLVIVLFIEEFFFRAFLTTRTGIIPSTILFSIAHIGYGSLAEIIGVFFLGLILAYWFKRNKSIIQNYFGHLIYDIFAIMLYFILG